MTNHNSTALITGEQTNPVRRLFPYAAIILFVSLILYPLLGGGKLYWGDISLYFEPMQQFASEQLKSGRLPLWNPYIMCGQPYLGNPQMAVFYPTSLFAPFVSASAFISISTVSHLILSGFAMFWYLSAKRLKAPSALTGAFLYAGSSCIVARVQFPPMVCSAPYCPLLLLSIDRYIDIKAPKHLIGVAVFTALLLLAGHPQMAYLILLLCSVYGIAVLIRNHSNSDTKSRVKIAAVLIGSAAVGCIVALVQLLPILQATVASTRERMTPGGANRFYFDISHLWTLVMPHYFGHPATGDYHGGGNAWEPALFAGWVPLPLMALACWNRRVWSDASFWIYCLLISMWLAIGTDGGLYWLAFYVLPGLSNFHDPARFLFGVTVAICVLSAYGVEQIKIGRIMVRSARYVVYAGLLLAIALPLVWSGREWNPVLDSQERSSLMPQMSESATSGRVYEPNHDVYWKRYVSDGYTDYGGIREISTELNSRMSNSQMTTHTPIAGGYEPVPSTVIADYDGLARTALRRNEPNSISLTTMMDASDLYVPTFRAIYNAEYQVDDRSGLKQRDIVVQHPSVAPRVAWLVHSARHVEGKLRIQSALCDPQFVPDRTAIISNLKGGEALKLPERPGNDPQPGSIVIKPVPNPLSHFDLAVDSGPSAGMLVISTAFYPGWHASVDHRRVSIVRADGAFMGIYLPAGVHNVSLVYEPSSVLLGIYVLCVCTFAFTTLAIFMWRRRSRLRLSSTSTGDVHV